MPWLEPYPGGGRGDALGLEFVAALQSLPPLERAALLLSDVAGFTTAEVAEVLSLNALSVVGSLRRAQAALGPQVEPAGEDHELVAGFAAAVEGCDVAALAALLADDAVLSAPAQQLRLEGRPAIRRFLSTTCSGRDLSRLRLSPTRANAQPAFGVYRQDPGRPGPRPLGLVVLRVHGAKIAAVTAFDDPSLLPRFGLP